MAIAVETAVADTTKEDINPKVVRKNLLTIAKTALFRTVFFVSESPD